MGNLGSKNTIKINKNDTTLIDMKSKCRDIKKFNKNLDTRIQFQNQFIQAEMLKGRKSSAVNALKYRKTLENMKEKSDLSLNNLKELIDGIEIAQLEMEIIKSLDQGNQALKRIQLEMPIDKVESIMDDTADVIAVQKQISELLGGEANEQDEDSLLEELDRLEAELAQEVSDKLPEVPSNEKLGHQQGVSQEEGLDLPSVPNTSISPRPKEKAGKKLEPMLTK